MFLLVGVDSEIGAATCRHMKALRHAVAGTTRRAERVAPDRQLLDLDRPLGNWTPPSGTQAVCIFAAVARLAACAADPSASSRINVDQTVLLVERLIAHGVHLLFLSSDKVFDGSVPNLRADAPTSPVSEYGRQKARTEAALRKMMERGAPVAILRLAKVIFPEMALLRNWATALADRRPVRAFHDMTVAPTPIATVARTINILLSERACGIFQLTGPLDVSYADIGRYIAMRLGVSTDLVEPSSVVSAGMPEGATPRYTTLDSALLRDRYGIAAPEPWAVIDPIIELMASA
ncbi:MAG: sugar nucleotide-binding protein [Candidatus Binataceae bacterium]